MEKFNAVYDAKTTDALTVCLQLLKRDASGLLDRETVARLELETIDKVSKDKASALKIPDTLRLKPALDGIIGNKKLPVPIGFGDFDALLDRRMEAVLGIRRLDEDDKPTDPKLEDLMEFKYALGPLLKENAATFAQLKTRLETLGKDTASRATEFLSGTWKSGFLGKAALSPIALGGGYLLFESGKRQLKNNANKLDDLVLGQANSLLGKAKYTTKLNRPGGFPAKKDEFAFQVKGKSSDELFTRTSLDDKGNDVTEDVTGLGVGVAISGEWFNHHSLSPTVGKTAQSASDDTDGCLWYSESTCAHYTTGDLRLYLSTGKILRSCWSRTSTPRSRSSPAWMLFPGWRPRCSPRRTAHRPRSTVLSTASGIRKPTRSAPGLDSGPRSRRDLLRWP
ncbi:hypothetical protein ACN28S_16920 [Cystobacter fuscus]